MHGGQGVAGDYDKRLDKSTFRSYLGEVLDAVGHTGEFLLPYEAGAHTICLGLLAARGLGDVGETIGVDVNLSMP